MYFSAIIAAFSETFLHAGANTVDSFISNNLFRRVSSLVFVSSVINLAFIPIIIAIDPPKMLTPGLFLVAGAIALIEVGYQYPYYWALRDADTSVVTSLFSLGDMITPLLAFLIVGERLAPHQYLGFIGIVVAGVLLTFDFKKFKLNEAGLLMLGTSFLLALYSVLFKYLFEAGISWGTALFWVTILQLLIASVSLLFRKKSKDFSSLKSKALSLGGTFFVMQAMTWAGDALGTFAISVIPVSIETAIGGIQPIFVILIALVFAKSYPKLFKEELDRRDLAKKVVLFALMIAGVILVTR